MPRPDEYVKLAEEIMTGFAYRLDLEYAARSLFVDGRLRPFQLHLPLHLH